MFPRRDAYGMRSENMELFSAQNIVKQFDKHTALNNVSMDVPEGSIFGLLGPNGAGKTTMLRIINQITAPDHGELFFKGEKLKPKHIHHIGYLPEERGLYKKMKVGEQSVYLARLKGLSKKDAQKKLNYWFEKFEIQAWWNKKIEELSKGMQQKIQFIVTILHEPDLLIFDEPFSGFDPINVNLLKQEILKLKEAGTTIIFSTHDMASVEELCDYIVLINKSENILNGQIDELKKKYKSNIFEIIFTENNFNLLESTLSFNYKILEHIKQNKNNILKVELLNDLTTNQFITHMLKIGEIVSFREVLPGMNDIFIKVVEENT